MKLDMSRYKFAVSSANDYGHLTLECTDESMSPARLLLEAELVDYELGEVVLTQHAQRIPLELIEEFVKRAKTEIKLGKDNGDA